MQKKYIWIKNKLFPTFFILFNPYDAFRSADDYTSTAAEFFCIGYKRFNTFSLPLNRYKSEHALTAIAVERTEKRREKKWKHYFTLWEQFRLHAACLACEALYCCKWYSVILSVYIDIYFMRYLNTTWTFQM